MSLMKTLAKVAIGIAVGKGVNSLMNRRGSARADDRGSAGGGFRERVGEMLGAGPDRSASGASSGGLGALLDRLGGGRAEPGRAPGGASLDDMLGGLTGRGGGGSGPAGGLGDMLGGLLGGAAASGGGRSFGDLFDQSIQRGGEPEEPPTAEQEAGAALMLRAMIQAAKADDRIDQDERRKLLENLDDASDSERAFVEHELSQPVDPVGLARQVPRGMEQQVYMMALMGIDLDNKAEAQFLHDLASAMSISQADVNSVHDSLGAPRLYA